MSKKTIAIFVALAVLTFGLVAPVSAQQQGSSGNQGGFFGMFMQFFSTMFHPNAQNQGGNPTGDQQDVNSPSGTPSGEPSGEPTGEQGEGSRLQGMVTAGKITAAQEQEIIAEINKIKSEISTWSVSTGINAGYVYGGLRGPGMSAGIGSGQNGQENEGQQGQQGGPNGQNFPNQGRPSGGMGPRGGQ